MFNKIMSIVRKTGDKCIIFDPGKDEVFVLMNLKAYEDLIDTKNISKQSALTDFLSADKIESVPQDKMEKKETGPMIDFEAIPEMPEMTEEEALDEERFYLEPIE